MRAPTYPDAGRPWRIAEGTGREYLPHFPDRHLQIRKAGPDEPVEYNISFKHMATVGEPIEPEVWRWYYDTGRKRQGCHRGHLVADRDRRLPLAAQSRR